MTTQLDQSNNNVEDIEYIKAPLGRRFLSYLIDIAALAILGVMLFALSNVISNNMSWKKNLENTLYQLRQESYLYQDDILISTFVESEEFQTDSQRANYLDQKVNKFYALDKFFSDSKPVEQYNARKLDAKDYKSIPLFKNTGSEIIMNPEAAPVDIANWYKAEVNNYAVGYLITYGPYLDANKSLSVGLIIQIVISITISFTVLYLILPITCFKRGRQTLGMKVVKISLINVYAMNEKVGVYIGRFFFMLIVFIYLNFVSFLIPTFISLGMTFFSKRSSSLVNYIFNDYVVLTKTDIIYLNEMERMDKAMTNESISIRNKNLRMK